MPLQTLKKISLLADRLDGLMHQVVLVGDASLEFYATDAAAQEHRTSRQVQCLVQASSMGDLYHWGENLKSRGFVPHDDLQPHQTFQQESLSLHIMPLRPVIRGVQQIWYEEGAFHAYSHQIPNGPRVRLLPAAYFLAAKIEAVNASRKRSFRMDENFEDLIYLLDNRSEILHDVAHTFYNVREYIQAQFQIWLQDPSLEEGICYALPFDAGQQGVEKILDMMRSLSDQRLVHAMAS
ncbi:MAG: hypothetical protein AAF135_16575 [Bacteroidota bacterium]